MKTLMNDKIIEKISLKGKNRGTEKTIAIPNSLINLITTVMVEFTNIKEPDMKKTVKKTISRWSSDRLRHKNWVKKSYKKH